MFKFFLGEGVREEIQPEPEPPELRSELDAPRGKLDLKAQARGEAASRPCPRRENGGRPSRRQQRAFAREQRKTPPMATATRAFLW